MRWHEMHTDQGNTGHHTRLMAANVLSSDGIDFTAIHLSVPCDSRNSKLDLTAMWNDDEQAVVKSFKFTAPTVEYTGDDAALSTDHTGTVSAERWPT